MDKRSVYGSEVPLIKIIFRIRTASSTGFPNNKRELEASEKRERGVMGMSVERLPERGLFFFLRFPSLSSSPLS